MDEGGLRQYILRELYPTRHRADRWLARSAEAKMVGLFRCSVCVFRQCRYAGLQ